MDFTKIDTITDKMVRWYYSRYPEKQADLLGGLNRLGE